MPHRKSDSGCTLIALLIGLSLTGCMVGPDFHSPATTTHRYTHTATAHSIDHTQKILMGQETPKTWWTLFHNKTLNDLIQTGFAKNPGLDAANAALIQAQETRNAEVGAALFPNISGQLAAQRQQSPSALTGDSNTSALFNLYNASINVSYSLDLFGGARRQLEYLQAQIDYQRFQINAAHLTLAGNIATTAFTIASLREQIAATKSLITAQESQLAIINRQRLLGGASDADSLLQESKVATLKSTLPPLQLSLDKNTHALAVLTGRPPADLPTPLLSLSAFKLPARLPVRLPSSLLEQRPDVKAAEALLHAANAQVGVTTANLLPQFTITGLLGSESNLPATLFKSGSGTWALGGSVLQPLYNGGSLRATRRAAIAARNQAAGLYQQTVLQALQNVADALRAIEHDAATLHALTYAKHAAERSLTIAQQQYQLGGNTFLDVLTAETTYQQARLSEITAKASRFNDTVALFIAAGGGGSWD